MALQENDGRRQETARGPRWELIAGILSAAMDLPPGERLAYVRRACGDSESLREEVESLLEAHEESGPFLEPPVARPLWDRTGERFGPWTLGEKLGEGGMGVVYKATREVSGVRQTAALKLASLGLARGEMERRFQSELRILAALDHPNITRLLDGGITPEGIPYLAMELVEGDSILDWCRARQLAVRERLELFGRIARTVHHAHQRLVVHRDIKPANILVNRDGEPKLLDFGIARLLEDDSGQETTAPMFRALSIDYASPEQLRGSRVTTATDVYALGILLYELVTGLRWPPRHGLTIEDALREAETTEPPKPSMARRDVEPDLDAIVARATRPEPRERYGSAEELAADVDRYLLGQPVAARKGTAFYLARKFTRRHKLAVACASVAVLAIAGGAVAFALEARVARRERARAEARFAETRALANRMIEQAQIRLEPIPGTLPFRRQMTSAGLRHLDKLASDAADDDGLAVELAQGYLQSADLLGNPNRANLGEPERAAESYAKALALLAPVLDRKPDHRAAVLSFLTASQRLVRLELAYRRFGRMREIADAASARARRGGVEDEPVARAMLLGIGYARSLGRLQSGDTAAAAEIDRAMRELENLRLPDGSGARQHRPRMMMGYKGLAEAHLDSGRTGDALAAAENASKWALGIDGSGLAAVFWRAQAEATLGLTLAVAGKTDDGLSRLRTSIATIRDLALKEPEDRQYKSDLAELSMRLGAAESKEGRSAAARAAFLEAMQFAGALADLRGAYPRVFFVAGRSAVELAGAESDPARRCALLMKAKTWLGRNEDQGVTLPSERRFVDAASEGVRGCR